MKLLSCIQPTEFLGIQHTQLIMHKIPGYTAAIMQPSHALCTLYLEIAQIWCDFCTCADLLIQPMHAHLTLSPSTNMAGSKGKLLYTLVPIVSEKELLLVNECAHRLAPYGLTLWVVSMNQMPNNCDLLNPISMEHGMGMPCGNWIQQFLNTFVCHNSWMYIHGRLEFMYDQEYHYCTPKNLYFYFMFCC